MRTEYAVTCISSSSLIRSAYVGTCQTSMLCNLHLCLVITTDTNCSLLTMGQNQERIPAPTLKASSFLSPYWVFMKREQSKDRKLTLHLERVRWWIEDRREFTYMKKGMIKFLQTHILNPLHCCSFWVGSVRNWAVSLCEGVACSLVGLHFHFLLLPVWVHWHSWLVWVGRAWETLPNQ